MRDVGVTLLHYDGTCLLLCCCCSSANEMLSKILPWMSEIIANEN